MVKNLPTNPEDARYTGSILGSGRCPWNRNWPPIPVFLPGKFRGQRILEVHRVAKSHTGLSTRTH